MIPWFPFGTFGNMFPYTNFHELNLDWIIAICKQLSTEYPDFVKAVEDALKKAMPAPVNEGVIGQFLCSLGNGESKWVDFAEEYQTVIEEAVNDWLTDHPEATTTVIDNSITPIKLTDQTRYELLKKQSGMIAPVYIGDYLCDKAYLPSATVKVGNTFICVNAPTDETAISRGSGVGIISIYDLTTNAKLTEYSVLTGHGNSIATDGTNFYIAPVWEYSGEGKTFTNSVYKYSSTFVLIAEINAPYPIMGLSYDESTNKLFALDYSGNIYTLTNNTFIPYTVITNWNDFYAHEDITNTRYYNQDFAVNNSEFYISSPFGNILHGLLKLSTCEITDFMQLLNTDSSCRFITGELEGFEFTDNHLYATVNINLPSKFIDSFVMEIPVNHTACTSCMMNGVFNVTDDTLYLDNDTKAKFTLQTNEIRSINQMFARKNNEISSRILIKDTADIVDPEQVYIIAHDITLSLEGKYECENIVVNGGTFTIQTNTAGNKLKLTKTNNYLLYVRRSGILKIAGEVVLNTDTPNMADVPNNFIAIGYEYPIVIIRQQITNAQNMTLRIGTEPITDGEMYVNTTPTKFMPHTFTITRAEGYISNSNRDLHINLNLPKEIKAGRTWTVTGTFTVRGIQGYVDNESADRNLSDFTVNFYRSNANTGEIVITKPDQFTNILNNTPITLTGNITISWT